jgi:Peptidase family S41
VSLHRAFVIAAIVLGLLAAGGSQAVLVPRADIDAENAYYVSLGLTLPKGGLVLPDPFDPPYSNRSFVVPRSWLNEGSAEPNPTVVASALRADLPTLRFIMQRTYSGWQTAADRGWDWDAWFRDWDRRLASSEDRAIPLRASLAPWAALEDFQPDNHTHPMLLGFTGGSLSASLASQPSSACTEITTASGKTIPRSSNDAAQQPHAVRAWDGHRLSAAWYVSYPDRFGPITSVTCGGRAIAATMTAQPLLDAVKPFYKDLGDGVAYVRTPFSFTFDSDEALRKLLAGIPALSNARAVLLDLRGNGGGAAPTGIFSTWFTPEQLLNVRNGEGRGSLPSCFAAALHFNLGQLFLFGNLKAPISDDTKAWLQRNIDVLDSGNHITCNPEKASSSVRRGALLDRHFTIARSVPRQTRIIAIVDNQCGSDCEWMMAYLEQLPDTVVAGTSTAGTIGFTQPGMLVLPHTRLNVMIATARDDAYGDGRSEASYGLAVDILLPTAESQSLQSLTALAHALLAANEPTPG